MEREETTSDSEKKVQSSMPERGIRKALFSGEEIHLLIPQRAPIVMLDSFFEGSDTDAVTGLTVRDDNLFCREDRFTEPGIIEHIAQSASALAGYTAYRKQKPIPVGYIGEVKKCRIFHLPKLGEELCTTIHIVSEMMNVSLLTAETKSGEERVASCQMKIYINE